MYILHSISPVPFTGTTHTLKWVYNRGSICGRQNRNYGSFLGHAPPDKELTTSCVLSNHCQALLAISKSHNQAVSTLLNHQIHPCELTPFKEHCIRRVNEMFSAFMAGGRRCFPGFLCFLWLLYIQWWLYGHDLCSWCLSRPSMDSSAMTLRRSNVINQYQPLIYHWPTSNQPYYV